MAKVSVATSSTALLAASTAKCDKIIMENLGANNVWVNIGATAVVDTGFVLAPNSGPYIFNVKGEGAMNAAINAIAETGATDVSALRI